MTKTDIVELLEFVRKKQEKGQRSQRDLEGSLGSGDAL